MKKSFYRFLLLAASMVTGAAANAQLDLVADQNPDYAVSRAKYMKLADSLNDWHSTTIQDTYKAIDWVADRAQARSSRRDFRQQLRLERARWGGNEYRYNNGYYPQNNFNYYPYNNYRRNRFGVNPYYGLNFWWR